MNKLRFGGALALSLLLTACGEKQDGSPNNRRTAGLGSAASDAGAPYSARGEVTAIAGDQVTISHGPVEGLGWPAMTMTFRAGQPRMAQNVSVGDRVSFTFKQDDGAYVLNTLLKEP